MKPVISILSLKGKPKGEPEGERPSASKEAGQALLDAIKADDADAVAEALNLCFEAYDADTDEDEEDE